MSKPHPTFTNETGCAFCGQRISIVCADGVHCLSGVTVSPPQDRAPYFCPHGERTPCVECWRDRNEQLERGAAPAPSPPDEIGWLIEGDGPERPVWWTGRWSDKGTEFMYGPLHTAMRMPRTTRDMEPEFSPDHACALRFARREDAERALGLLPAVYQAMLRVSEHMWMGVSAPTPEDLTTLELYEIAERVRKVGSLDNAVSVLRAALRGVGSPQPAPEAK